jgi:hypothetical protein
MTSVRVVPVWVGHELWLRQGEAALTELVAEGYEIVSSTSSVADNQPVVVYALVKIDQGGAESNG